MGRVRTGIDRASGDADEELVATRLWDGRVQGQRQDIWTAVARREAAAHDARAAGPVTPSRQYFIGGLLVLATAAHAVPRVPCGPCQHQHAARALPLWRASARVQNVCIYCIN